MLAAYVKITCFKGKCISLSVPAQGKVSKVITSRCNATNVDWVSTCMSSNKCENFFSMMTKYTEGKRRYLPVSLGPTVLFVACLHNNHNLSTKVLQSLGAESPLICDRKRENIEKKRKRGQTWKKTEAYKTRRKQSKQLKLEQLAHDGSSAKCHKPGKLKPTNDCSATTASVASDNRPKKPSTTITCGNCSAKGHNKTQCG